MSAPWLSVLMPTYNGATHIRSALDSVLSQGVDGVECIVVDDGSTDDTLSILESYADRMDLTVVERPRQGNWVTNTNIALGRARGKHASMLHQDDCWHDDRLRVMRALMESYPEVDFYLHAAQFIDGQGKALGLWRCPLPTAPRVLTPQAVVPRLLVQNFIAIPAPIFSVRKARDLGDMDEALRYTADWDLWLRLAASGTTLYHPAPLCSFRVHGGAQTAKLSRDLDEFKAEQQVVLDRSLDQVTKAHPSFRGFRREAQFSIAMNTALAARYHGHSVKLVSLIAAFLAMGPLGWYRYLTCSRIVERVRARLRAGMGRRAGGKKGTTETLATPS